MSITDYKSRYKLKKGKVLSYKETWHYRFSVPISIELVVFFTNHKVLNSVFLHNYLTEKMSRVLNKYNFIFKQIEFSHSPIDYNGEIITEEHAGEIRTIAGQIYERQGYMNEITHRRIFIIYAPINESKIMGNCFHGVGGFFPFIIINTNKFDTFFKSDGITLLHEIGHSVNLKHSPRTNKSVIEDIMMTPDEDFKTPFTDFNRINISRIQAENFLNSDFTFIENNDVIGLPEIPRISL